MAKIRSLWIWLLYLEEDYMLCQVSFSKDNLKWPELGLLFIFISNILATFATQGWQDGPMKHISFRSHSCHVHVVACQILDLENQGECHQSIVLALVVLTPVFLVLNQINRGVDIIHRRWLDKLISGETFFCLASELILSEDVIESKGIVWRFPDLFRK